MRHKLRTLIQEIRDNTWEIWAEAPFEADSDARYQRVQPGARYGQAQFDEQGRLLDAKEFFARGRRCGNHIAEYCNGNEFYADEAARALIGEIEEERKAEVLRISLMG